MAHRYEERLRLANDEIVGKGNFSAVDEFFTADFVLHAGGKEHQGTQFVRRFVRQLRSAIPDLRVVEVEFFLQAGETIAWQRTLCGTHEKDLKGIPPSGKRVEWRDMVVTRFENDKIAEDWAISDLAGQLLLKLPAP